MHRIWERENHGPKTDRKQTTISLGKRAWLPAGITWPVCRRHSHALSLCPFPETGPPLPSIADAHHRDLATHRDFDNLPKSAISGGTAMHTVSLTSLSALKEIPAAQKCFSKARSSTSF